GTMILESGGNAVDAAVAVGFSLTTTLPRAGNIGGGGFMLVYIKETEELFSIDYRSRSSLNSNLEDLFGSKSPAQIQDDDYDLTKYDYKASAVPGTVYGLLEAHERFGDLPLEKVLQPVIDQARNGIIVSYDLHNAIGSSYQLKEDPESRKIYFENNKPVAIGSLMKRPDLAKTFEAISKEGKDGFYDGWVAEKIQSSMKDNGGFIDSNDLKQYSSKFRDPIGVNYRGYSVYTQGPPSGGGITFLTALNVLSYYNLGKYRKDSSLTYHLLAEALRRGHNNRSHHVGDPDYYDVPTEGLISKGRAKLLAKSISFDKASKASSIQKYNHIEESKDTTHYSVIDRNGNAVSNTYTLGYSFGSGVTIPGTGILMNNQMRNFAYKYGDKTSTSRASSPGNRFEPGKRPMSTMHPVMVFNKKGELSLITGSPGGSQIPAANLRVVTGVIDFDLHVGDATMLPRIHKDWPYADLDFESTVSQDNLNLLDRIGHQLELSDTIGSTQSIQIIDGINYGFADLRRPNAGVSIEKSN
ncbi:gamma-glutamyltransferase, partial [Pseudomonadota bacterium]|nr:gamma-glutamyltransferase [Pseudomonadota bacterium]